MTSKRTSKNKQQTSLDNFVDMENVDFDRADEFLLNAKKKKLEDTYRDEDQEDLLFHEPKSKSATTHNVVDTSNKVVKNKTISSRLQTNYKNGDKTHHKDVKPRTKLKIKKHSNNLVINEIAVDNNHKHTQLTEKKNNKGNNRIKEISAHKISYKTFQEINITKKNTSKDSVKPSRLKNVSNHNKAAQRQRQEDNQHPKSNNLIKDITQRHIKTKEYKANSTKLNTTIINLGTSEPQRNKIEVRTKSKSTYLNKNYASKNNSSSKQNVLDANKKLQRSHFDVVRPTLLECRDTTTEKGSYRTPIRVNGSGLRLKMLERLQAAQSRYTSSRSRRRR